MPARPPAVTSAPAARRRRRDVTVLLLLAASVTYLAALLYGYLFGTFGVRRHHVESASYIFAVAAVVTALLRHRETERTSHGTLPPWRVVALAFVLGALALYRHAIFLGLFSDDYVLADRALAGDWSFQETFVRPAPLVLWRLLLPVGGSVALHLLNVALHGLNAALIARLAARVGLAPWSALAAGALFVTFPVVEAVVWPAAVHDVLVTTCALAFLNLQTHLRTPAGIATAVGLVALGLLTKESAVVLPVLAIVLWAPRAPGSWAGVLAGLGVCAVYVAVRLWLVPLPDTFAQPPTRYLFKELLARTYGTLAMPWSAAVIEKWPALAYGWAMATVLGAAGYAAHTAPAPPPGTMLRLLGAAVVSILPVYSMFFVTADLENARYLYLSTGIWAIALASFIQAGAQGHRRLPPLAFACLIAVGTLGVELHLRPWREAARLRDRVLAAAARVVESAPCPVVSLTGAPDSWRGAYVFRNGLAEAVSAATGTSRVAQQTECLFMWDGSEFHRTEPAGRAIQATLAR